MTTHFMKAMAVAAFTAALISGCAAQTPVVSTVSSPSSIPSESTAISISNTEKAELKAAAASKAEKTKKAEADAAAAAKVAADAKAASEAGAAKVAADAKAAADEKVRLAQVAPAVAAPVKVVAPAPVPAPAQDFNSWVNSTLARYGVTPGPGSSFQVGNTGFCGGYMCTTVKRYGKDPFSSVTVVSPGAIGNEFALIHEVAHQYGVGLRDTGGECAADVWARQYLRGSIYC